jgi:putative DNA primase/helicase
MRPIDRVLERLEGVQENSAGYKARCPVLGHGQGRGDRNPSLILSEGEDGRVLITCRAGCRTDHVVAELGLKMKDLFENGKGGGGLLSLPVTLKP